jgi:16S rRNA C1402 (ribose-2'-O) methylase RsmI
MKLKTSKKSKNKIIQLNLTKFYKKTQKSTINFNIHQIKLNLKKILFLIYFYSISKKKILFLGFPNNTRNNRKKEISNISMIKYKIYNKFINNSNKIINTLNSAKKQTEISDILTENKIKLIVIRNYDTNTEKIIKESYKKSIPIILICYDQTFSLDNKIAYKLPDNKNSKKIKDNDFFIKIIKSILQKHVNIK